MGLWKSTETLMFSVSMVVRHQQQNFSEQLIPQRMSALMQLFHAFNVPLIHVSYSLHHENTVENKLTFWPSLPGIPSFPSLPGTPWNHRILIFTSQWSQIWFGFIQNWLEPTGFPGKPGEPGDPALPFSPWKKHSLNTFSSWIDASVWDNLEDYHLTILSR